VLRVAGLREPATARIVGTRAPGAGTLNHLVVRSGRRMLAGETDAVVVSAGFADANGVALGDTLGAVVGDRWRTLRVVGIATTAEFLYEIRSGDVLPDPRRSGVLWLDAEVAADALGYDGAWNDAAFTLAPGADPRAVIASIDGLLERYGTLGAHDRDRHPSHKFVSEEIRQNQTFALMLPVIFLGVAAFLVHLVLGRVVTQQRDQVGTLKAFGVPSTGIARHYVLFALVPVLAGTVVGAALGIRFAAYLAAIYADFFRFPSLALRIAPVEMALAILIAVAAAVIGAVGALRRLLALAPAVAMRPEPPAVFGQGMLDRLLTMRIHSPVWRMIARSVAHQPLRTVLSALGIGLGSAVVVLGTFGFESVQLMRRIVFEVALRADVTVAFAEAQGANVLTALAAMPGVIRVEPVRSVGVRMRHEHRQRQVAITGVSPGAQLRQVAGVDAEPIEIAEGGIVLSVTLGRVLDVAVGDTVDLEFLDGRGRRVSRPVAALVDDITGLGAYVTADALPGLVGVGEVITGADLAVDPAQLDTLYARLAEAPMVQTVQVRDAMREAFDATMQENFLIILITLMAFSAALAAGTIYNAGRVTLSERSRDLASLRVLGFTRGEVSRILFGELSVLATAGVPVGLALGAVLSWAIIRSFETEYFRLPVVIGPQTIAWGILIPAGAAILAGWPLRRRLDRLDLIGVLKTRE
jgi:putative ABC transport system permease protein